MADEFVIWWTTQTETNAIGDRLPEWCPAYLHEQYASRRGRSGRCRLWVSQSIDAPRGYVRFDDESPTALQVSLQETNAAGIVMRARDVERLAHLPGIVTDFDLVRWPP